MTENHEMNTHVFDKRHRSFVSHTANTLKFVKLLLLSLIAVRSNRDFGHTHEIGQTIKKYPYDVIMTVVLAVLCFNWVRV